MAQANIPTRLIVCVDGTWCNPDGVRTTDSPTSIYRIFATIKKGECTDNTTGKTFFQKKRYVPGIGSADQPGMERWISGVYGNGYLDQIRDVYKECCTLTDPNDEVWLFGFSRGAYVVRAVAGLLHYGTALKSANENAAFERDYKELLGVYKEMRRQSTLEPAKIHYHFTDRTTPAPKIQFVGVFDTVKAVNDKSLFDITYNSSIMHLRHALALHEDRNAFLPEYVFPDFKGAEHRLSRNRSFIQAWFVGAHIDIGGSGPKAGLALYPLQWMLLECKAHGLCLGFDGSFGERAPIDNPLSLVRIEADGEEQTSTPWSCTTKNGITLNLMDIRGVADDVRHQGHYAIQIRRNRKLPWPRKTREAFVSDGSGQNFLNGYCEFAPQGTIIHPSVYLLLDEQHVVYQVTEELKLIRAVEKWRHNALGHYAGHDGFTNQGFWNDRDIIQPDNPGAIRALVCGNTGVGKSTLINLVFGVEVTPSSDRSRGLHNVNDEIKFADRPDLVVHDSGGFEAASTDEFEAIERFLKERSAEVEISERVQVIWFCLEVSTSRPNQSGTEKLFRAVKQYAQDVPFIVVATKTDDFLAIKFKEHRQFLKRQRKPFDAQACDEYAETKLQERLLLIEDEMLGVKNGRLDACVGISRDDDDSIKALTKITFQCFTNEKVRLLYVRAQVARLDLKIDLAINEVMKLYRRLIHTAAWGGMMPGWSSTNRMAGAIEVCKAIMLCFGLPTVNAHLALQIYRNTFANDIGNSIAIGLAEGLAAAGVISSIALAGSPIFLATGAINVALVVPATARLLLCLAADLILVMSRSFREAADKCIVQPQARDLTAASRSYVGMSREVHQAINKLIPRRNFVASFKSHEIRLKFADIITYYKPRVMEEIEALPGTAFRNTYRDNHSEADSASTYINDDKNDIQEFVEEVKGR